MFHFEKGPHQDNGTLQGRKTLVDGTTKLPAGQDKKEIFLDRLQLLVLKLSPITVHQLAISTNVHAT
jgi:hypothetical protein